MLKDIFKASTYTDDLPLFEELGLTPFKNLSNHNKTFLGTVDKSFYTVKVWVDTAPAQFWSFEIYNKDADLVTYRANTGSGSLKEYWPSIEMLAEGMLATNRINKVEI